MPYVYHCVACQASAPPRSGWADARSDQTEHRERAHHGLIPDDRIDTQPGLLSLLLADAARAARQPRPAPRSESEVWRQIRQTTYWRQAMVLLGGGAVLLFLLALLAG